MSDLEPADKDRSSPSAKITITVLKGDDIDANCARLTYLCPISEDEVTVSVEKKEPLPLDQSVFSRPSRVPERCVLSLPALCDGPPTPLEPVFKRASPPPLQYYRREPEEADVCIRRDSVDSELSSTGYDGDYERDGEVDDPDAPFTQAEEEGKDFLPLLRRNSLVQGRRLPRPDSFYENQEDDHYLERPSNPVADAYSSDEDDEFSDLDNIVPVPYLTSQVASASESDDEDESVPAYTGGLPLSRGPATPPRASRPVLRLAESKVEKVMQWVRGTKRGRSESPSPERDADVDESIHVAKKSKLMAVYAY